MTFEQFLSAGLSVTSLLLLAVFLNHKGVLLWRSQVEREIAAIVAGAEKLETLLREQAEEERQDKNAWKATAQGFMPVTRTAVEGVRSAVEGVTEVVKKVGP